MLSPLLAHKYKLGVVLFGTSNSAILKYMDIVESRESTFYHPSFQSFLTFIGQLLCLGIYRLFNDKKRHIETTPLLETDRPFLDKLGKKLFVISALFCYLGLIASLIGLSLSALSIVQMIQSSRTIFIAIMSLVLLKRPICTYQ